jgi:hypothetical protein
MSALKTRFAALALALVAGAVGAGQDAVACGDGDFNQEVRSLRQASATRGVWYNTLMPAGTGRYASASADQVLGAILVSYTRQVLDRGGWLNVVMATQGYAAGNPLLAVRAGEGVTTAAVSPRVVFSEPQHLSLAD